MSVPFDLSRFFTYSLDMLCIASFDGYFKCINPAFTHWLGWSEEELLSRPFVSFVHPADVVKTEAEMLKLSRGELCVSFENRYRHKESEWLWIMWTAYPDLERSLIYAVARNISERKEREELQELKLARALSQLERLGELLPICSHCKNVRNDEGYWKRIETFLEENVDQRLTHSICPACAEREFGAFIQQRLEPESEKE